MATSDWTDAAYTRDGGVKLEAVNVNELAELEAVGKDEFGVAL